MKTKREKCIEKNRNYYETTLGKKAFKEFIKEYLKKKLENGTRRTTNLK